MTTRNIGGSIFPSSCPAILVPLPWRGGNLVVRPLPDDDTHALIFADAGGETELARHPNGHSCRALAERIVAGGLERIMEQARYIERCGGTVALAALERVTH